MSLKKIKKNLITNVEKKYYPDNNINNLPQEQTENYCYNCGELSEQCECGYTKSNCDNTDCIFKYNDLLNKYENSKDLNKINYNNYIKELKDENLLLMNPIINNLKQYEKYWLGFGLNNTYYLNKIKDLYINNKKKYKADNLFYFIKHQLDTSENLDKFFLDNDIVSIEKLKDFIRKYKNHKCYDDISSKNNINLYNLEKQIKINNILFENKKIKYINLNFRIDYYKYVKIIKNKFYKNIKKELEYVHEIKKNNNNIINEIDSILEDINKEYKLVECKNNDCKHQCYDDIGYCLTHHPDICSVCNQILDKNTKLINNKKYNIEKCCYTCSYKKYFDYFVKNYKIDDILYIFDENDELYNTKKVISQKNYYEIESDMLILKDIKNRDDLLKKEIIELYGYNFDENNEYNKYNDFTKYKLYNRITRSDDLFNTFGDNLKNIKIKPSFYSYMGKQEYVAFKKFLTDLFEKDKKHINKQEIDDLLNNLPSEEPPSDWENTDEE